MVLGWVFASLVGTVHCGSIPTEFSQTDFRAVVRHRDQRFQAVEMFLFGIRWNFARFAPPRPMTGSPRICPRSEQRDLIVACEGAEFSAKLFLGFRIDRSERTNELLLKLLGLYREQQVEIAVDECFLRPCTVCCGDDYVAKSEERR